MRLLDRYLLRELLMWLGYFLGGFLIIYVAFDLIFSIRSFQDKQLGPGDIAEYYVVTLPELLVSIVIPVSLLLALLYTLTHLSRHNELIAMRAAGVGLLRLSAPYFAVAILLGAAVFAVNELLVPPSMDRAREILQRHRENRDDPVIVKTLNFHNEADRRHWLIDSYNRATSEMTGVHIIADLTGITTNAARGVFSNGVWIFDHAEEWATPAPTPGDPNPQAQAKVFPELKLRLPETPAWINSEIKLRALNATEAARKPQLSIREIRNYLHLHPNPDESRRAMLMTQLQCRFAGPFTCLAVLLIALPFGARSGRRNVSAGVASAIFICFAYIVMQRLAMGMGVGGTLPPVAAAWLPNAIFGLTGMVLLWRAI
jgi:LPS export ABC transporter permease LptG